MPYQIIQISPRRYAVVNSITGKVHAKNTTLTKAKKQIHLMQMIDNRK